jgi:hypothetical protein
VIPEIEVLTSDEYVEPPEVITNAEVLSQVETEEAFGMDFPAPLDPPPMGEQGLISTPVTSGGDSALLGQSEDGNL